MHLGGVHKNFADVGSVKQIFWSWLDLLICAGVSWVLTDLDCLRWGDFILFYVSLTLHQANTDMFSWLWQGKRTNGNSSTYQVLARVTLVNIALAKAGHKARPRIGVG